MKSISPRSSMSPSSAPDRRLREAHIAGQSVAETVGTTLHPFDIARLDAVFVLRSPRM